MWMYLAGWSVIQLITVSLSVHSRGSFSSQATVLSSYLTSAKWNCYVVHSSAHTNFITRAKLICCFCCAHHRIVAAFLFVTLVTRLCAGCIIMSHVPHVKFSHTLTDSAVLVPFSRMPHPPHFNPVPLPNRGNLPGRKEHLLHKVGQLPLVGYPHNHQRSFVSKVGKGEIQQLVWGEPPVSCEFVYVSVFRKLVTTPAVIYVNSAKY